MKQKFWERRLDGTVRIYVKVKPLSSAVRIGGVLDSGELKVYLTEIPEGGKANKQLISFLSREFKIPKGSIILEKGEKSQNKVISLMDCREDLDSLLRGYES